MLVDRKKIEKNFEEKYGKPTYYIKCNKNKDPVVNLHGEKYIAVSPNIMSDKFRYVECSVLEKGIAEQIEISYMCEVLRDDCDCFHLFLDFEREMKEQNDDNNKFIMNYLEDKFKDEDYPIHIAECCRKTTNGFKYSFRIVADIWFTSKYRVMSYIKKLDIDTDFSVYESNKKVRMVKQSKGFDKCLKKMYTGNEYYDKPFTIVTEHSKISDFFITKLGKPEMKRDIEPYFKLPKNLKTYYLEYVQEEWSKGDYLFYDELLSNLDDSCYENYEVWRDLIWALLSKNGPCKEAVDLIHKHSKRSKKYGDGKEANRLICLYSEGKISIDALQNRKRFPYKKEIKENLATLHDIMMKTLDIED